MSTDHIRTQGARLHNLKDSPQASPQNQLLVFSGLSRSVPLPSLAPSTG